MDIVLFLLKWAAIAAAGLAAATAAVIITWQSILGLLFVAGFPYYSPVSAFRALQNMRGYDPANYVMTADEATELKNIDARLDRQRSELAAVSDQHSRIPTKKDGSIDFRYGGARELDDKMTSLPSIIDGLVTDRAKVADAPLERARAHSTPRARLFGYAAVPSLTVVLIALGEIIIKAPATHWTVAVAKDAIKYLGNDAATALAAFLSAGFGRWLMLTLRDGRARQIVAESDELLSQYGSGVVWVAGYSGPLERRTRLEEPGGST